LVEYLGKKSIHELEEKDDFPCSLRETEAKSPSDVTNTNSVEDIIVCALISVYKFCKKSVPEVLSKDAFYIRSNGKPVCFVDYIIQAILINKLTSILKYPVMAEEDAIVLKDPNRKTLYLHVIQLVKEHISSNMSEEEILDLIGYANYGEYDGYRWIINPIHSSKNLMRSKQPISVSVALSKDGVTVAAGILLLFRKSNFNEIPNHTNNNEPFSSKEECYDARIFLSSERSPDVLVVNLPSKKKYPLSLCHIEDYNKLDSMYKLMQMKPSSSLNTAKILSEYSCLLYESNLYGYSGLLNGDLPIYICTESEFSEIIRDRPRAYHLAGLYLVQKLSQKITTTDFLGNTFSCIHQAQISNREIQKGIISCLSHLHNSALTVIQYIINPPPQDFRVTIKGTFVDENAIRNVLQESLSIRQDDLQVYALEI
jgi:3'-phosphoadenosine 5'-phosphosulfate (PAPS) 3'-phosphatase